MKKKKTESLKNGTNITKSKVTKNVTSDNLRLTPKDVKGIIKLCKRSGVETIKIGEVEIAFSKQNKKCDENCHHTIPRKTIETPPVVESENKQDTLDDEALNFAREYRNIVDPDGFIEDLERGDITVAETDESDTREELSRINTAL